MLNYKTDIQVSKLSRKCKISRHFTFYFVVTNLWIDSLQAISSFYWCIRIWYCLKVFQYFVSNWQEINNGARPFQVKRKAWENWRLGGWIWLGQKFKKDERTAKAVGVQQLFQDQRTKCVLGYVQNFGLRSYWKF